MRPPTISTRSACSMRLSSAGLMPSPTSPMKQGWSAGNSIWRRNDTAVGKAWRCAKSANCCTAWAFQREPPRIATGALACASICASWSIWPAAGAASITS
ncbi:Uncharacterised protein [Bordetella pertussis]|nr:Uncharacterised protein [Bordetella pertussis]CFW32944.1 Uncharacterised protein [Bordetella pertussis]